MRILLVVTKAEIGGAQKRIIDLASSYQEAGHKVTVASGPGEYLPDELEKLGIEHVRFDNLSRANPVKIIRYMFDLWRFLRGRNFDIAHLNSSSALAGALPAKLTRPSPKTVFTFRGLSILAPGYRVSKLKKFLFRMAYKAFLPFVDVGVFQCEANQKSAHKMGINVKQERVIMDGIPADDIEFLSEDVARERLEEMVDANLEGKKLVGSIGRLSYQKHYSFLIQQMRKLQKYRADVACIIIGDGPKREDLEAEIKRLGLEDTVFLAGKQPEAARFIPGFDVFTLVSRYEGLSMTLTEAMHAGAVMLVSDVGCASEVVGDERMIFQPGNAVGFVSKLRNLLDAEDRQELSGEVGQRAEGLVLEKSARKYMNLYKQKEGGEENKKILIVIASLKQGGGAEFVAATTGTGLYERGHEVHYLSFYDADNPLSYKGNYHTLNENEDSHPLVKSLQLFKRAYKIKQYAKKNNIDVVISHMEESNFAASISRVLFGIKAKLIGTVHTNPLSRSRWYYWAIKLLYPQMDRVVTCSQGVAGILKDRFSLESVQAIYNPVDIVEAQKQSEEEIPQQYKNFFSTGELVYINIGRLTRAKGQWHLIRAFSKVVEKMSEAKLIILGEGELRSDLEILIEKLALQNNVVLAGNQSNVFPFLSRADCFVSTSLWEGLQITLIESLAVGTPVISTDCPIGPREIIAPSVDGNKELSYPFTGDNGILTAPFDKDENFEETLAAEGLLPEEKMLAGEMLSWHKNMADKFPEKISGLERFYQDNIVSQWEKIS